MASPAASGDDDMFVAGMHGYFPDTENSWPDVSSASEMANTPLSVTDGLDGHHLQTGSNSRKRSFSSHVDGDLPELPRESKSAKTTPPVIIDLDAFDSSPVKSHFPSDVIDLTGDDDEVDRVLEEQRRVSTARHQQSQQKQREASRVKHETPAKQESLRPGTLWYPDSYYADLSSAGPSNPQTNGASVYPGQTVASSQHHVGSGSPWTTNPSTAGSLQQPSGPGLGGFMPASMLASSSSLRLASDDWGNYRLPGSYVDEDSFGDEGSDEEFRRMNNLPPSDPTYPSHPTVPSSTASTLLDRASASIRGMIPFPGGNHNVIQSFFSGLTSSVSGGISIPQSLPAAPQTVADAPHQLSQNLQIPLVPHINVQAREKTKDMIQQLLENIRPDSDIPADRCEATPDAMRVTLMPHQKIALKWMKDQEDGVNKGGILADEMGLGKTVSMISLLVARPGRQTEVKTNLVIGPVSLITQWKEEIDLKIKRTHRLNVLLWHNKKGLAFDDLRRYDVVLTTYGRCASEAQRMAAYKKDHEFDNIDFDSDIGLRKICPLLHSRSHFHRIILDEAQYIKNSKTITAQAVHRLKGTHRWCLTGTPMMNGVHELQSLLCFVRIEPYTSAKIFQNQFGALSPNGNTRTRQGGSKMWSEDKGMEQLQVVLKATMLRRTKKSQIDGKPIIELPPKSEQETRVGFSEEERKFYTALETSSRDQFNIYQRAGTISKNYSTILVLLLRLRQACCHPHLNMDWDFVEPDPAKIDMVKGMTPDVVATLKANLSYVCPTCSEPMADPQLIVPCGHSICSECLRNLAQSSQQIMILAGAGNDADNDADLQCPTCNGVFKASNTVNCATFKSVYPTEDGPGTGPAGMGAAENVASDSSAERRSEESGASSPSDHEWSEESDDEDSITDVDDDGNLANFIVPDEVSDDESSSSDEELEPVGKLFSKAASEVEPEADEELDVTLDKPPKEVSGQNAGESGGLIENSNDDDKDDEDYKDNKDMEEEESDDGSDAKDVGDNDDGEFRPAHKASRKKAGPAPKDKKKTKTTETANSKGKAKRLPKKKRPKVTASMLADLRMKAKRSKTDRARYMKYLSDNWITSTKVDTCCRLLYDMQKTGEKTLVFSVWTVMLDLLEVAIRKELRMKVVRYDGGMSIDQRAQAVQRLREEPDVTVMLMSLRAGNAGLNLTSASQVIIMDPFWNPYVEMQAVDRAHRIGQERPVRVHRILVNETIEDRIVAMQQRKRELVEAALDEGKAQALGRLSHRDLAFLFNGGGGRSG